VTGYPASLDALWAAHLAPRAGDAPTCVSLFSGCGGSSLGYSAAGYRELLAAEWDRHACEVFRGNFSGIPVHEGDVAALDPGSLPLPAGGLDLLDASPPCQGVSMTGLRRAADPRNQLWHQVVRLAGAWRPRVIVVENVKGLIAGKMRSVFAAICAGLRELDYVVGARLIDSSFLGVPQKRVRVFIVAVRCDLGTAPVFPAPRTRPVTVREAWEGLDGPGAFDVPVRKGAVLAPLIEPGRNGSDALTRRGGKPAHFSAVRLAWDRPANTLVREVRPGTCSGFLHPREDRFLGVHELARLQGFPDQWDWCGLEYRDVHHLVGNSVCPSVAQAVGAAPLPMLVPGTVPA
jgi:DNA (cytosine-5)-methyltransferase 1